MVSMNAEVVQHAANMMYVQFCLTSGLTMVDEAGPESRREDDGGGRRHKRATRHVNSAQSQSQSLETGAWPVVFYSGGAVLRKCLRGCRRCAGLSRRRGRRLRRCRYRG